MTRIAFFGDINSFFPFTAFGANFIEQLNGKEHEQLKDIIAGEFDIIYITEDIFKTCEDIIAETSKKKAPVITVLPSSKGSKNIGANALKKAALIAINADII